MAQMPGHAGPAPMQGQTPRYKILGRIASGGMGAVYLGARIGDPYPAGLVAIKVIHQNLAENRVFVDMLIDEARLASKIHHTNVVGITDVGAFGNRHFVVMPYIEGGTLSELVHQHSGHLPVALVAHVLSEALDGLHAAHSLADDQGRSLGLVHRDVSPANMLIGVDGITRVIDFGVAKARTRITQTAPGTIKGKFSYMAPEQAMGEEVDCRADVFSAGVVLWSVLTGKRLFAGKNSAHTIRNLMNAEIVPPSRVRSKVPPVFDDVCLRALHRSAYKRYQSAADMASALRLAAQAANCRITPADVGKLVSQAFAERIRQRRKVIEQPRRTSRSITVDQPGFERHVADLDERQPAESLTPATPSGRVARPSPAAVEQGRFDSGPSISSPGARRSDTPSGTPGMGAPLRPPSNGLTPAEAQPMASLVVETLSGRLVPLTREEVVARTRRPRRHGKYLLLAALLALVGLGVTMRAELLSLLGLASAPAAPAPAASPTLLEPVRIAVDPPAQPAAQAADAMADAMATAEHDAGAPAAPFDALPAALPGPASGAAGTADAGPAATEPGQPATEPGQPAGAGASSGDSVSPSDKPDRPRKRQRRRQPRPRPAPPTLDLGN